MIRYVKQRGSSARILVVVVGERRRQAARAMLQRGQPHLLICVMLGLPTKAIRNLCTDATGLWPVTMVRQMRQFARQAA